MIDLQCKICNVGFKVQRDLIKHIQKVHDFQKYENYILHYYDDLSPTCKCGCGTKLKFYSHKNPVFYDEYTRNHWPHKLHTTETKAQIKKTLRTTLLEKYGVDNPMKCQAFIDNIAKTKKDRYGSATYNNVPKNKKTRLERYGDEKYQNTQKIIETNIAKYGAHSFTATDAGKAQVKKTKLERYGDENYQNLDKMRATKLERYGYECEFNNRVWRNKHNLNETKIHTRLKTELGCEQFIYHGYEFDLKHENNLIEIDGNIFHAESLIGMSIIQITSIVNDYRKTLIVDQNNEFQLLRVRVEDLKNLVSVTFDDILRLKYIQDFSFGYKTKFMTKEYFTKFIEKNGKSKLQKYVNNILRFIKEFQPTFPIIESAEVLSEVVNKISRSKHLPVDMTFNNNSSNIGVSYLKSRFNSYWKSSYLGNKSPCEVWQDDKLMKKIISYRIGLNDSNEIFDLSLHQMVRGISAIRHTISFFKPVLAGNIYHHFLGEMRSPTVFDPCAGFGGRLLGFKSKYPNGTYIGVEPNIETFNELVELSKNFENVKLFNCKIEDFDISILKDVDLTFTSIPYFDAEIYSNQVLYKNYEDWKNQFLSIVIKLPNLLLNIPNNLREEFGTDCEEYYIQSNTSHFNKKTNVKREFLLKF